MWRLLPFAHAMAECNITSRLFGLGKGVTLQKLNSAPIYKQMAEVFCGQESGGDTVSAGEMALSSLYGAQTGGPGCFALPTILREGIEKQNNCATIQSASHLGSLRPTASYHSARVYLQVP